MRAVFGGEQKYSFSHSYLSVEDTGRDLMSDFLKIKLKFSVENFSYILSMFLGFFLNLRFGDSFSG